MIHLKFQSLKFVLKKNWVKMSRGGFCYSGCQLRKGCEQQGSSPRCERELQCSLGANQTHPPEQRLTFPINTDSWLALSSPGLSHMLSSQLRLSSILCWHRQAAPSVTRLINSCWAVIPTAIVIHAHALAYAHSRTSTDSKFPTWRQSSVSQFAHFDMFWRFLLLVWMTTAAGFTFCLLPSDQMNWW